jgi:hypothetical protein
VQPRRDPATERGSALRRWGPLAVVLALVAGVTVVAFAGGDADSGTATGPTAEGPVERPEGAISWSMAQEQGLDVHFPDTCDRKSGKVAIPFYFRSECFADADDNGGATARGVTGDTITVVAWLPAEDDPVRSLLLNRIGFNATNADLEAAYKGYVEIFSRYYQTYGRHIDLKFLEASGSILDNTAARADAVRAAEEMGAFAVLGGPIIGSAWTDELHARGVVCIACPGISDAEPTVFSLPPSAGQIRTHLATYVGRKLAGGQAEFAGEDLRDETRVFGFLGLGLSDGDERGAQVLEDQLLDEGVSLAEKILYPLDPGRASELATNAITRMKTSGVTTVLVQADPILLPAFTSEATKQNWFPEWVVGGAPFVDTTTFARTFDQRQWAHAFGISYFPPQVAEDINPPVSLYQWYFGEKPPVEGTIPLLLLYPQVALFLTGLEYAGPQLTVDSFHDGLFLSPPTPAAVTQPSVSYGDWRWTDPDYAAIDDMVELWWDPDARGTDEAGDEGDGMYRYVDGAKRFLVDDWTDDVRVFDRHDAPTIIEELPADEVPPDYPSPAHGR